MGNYVAEALAELGKAQRKRAASDDETTDLRGPYIPDTRIVVLVSLSFPPSISFETPCRRFRLVIGQTPRYREYRDTLRP